ncbi:phosphofurin acidic cluster sorting protein 2 [Elysia marginata]|uniref:Phosphofurin acidic cluster sorting protein 2 n=1 Tax=Elysia marginata TaxID=1093978 RepID=A0AAV4HFJ2_9GAST|nr:phosphofurin acidic cluster sorting protein 2 [Elysia marginata]
MCRKKSTSIFRILFVHYELQSRMSSGLRPWAGCRLALLLYCLSVCLGNEVLHCAIDLYKAISYGVIICVCYQVLQCAIDRELPLYSDVKEQTKPVASLLLHGLSSQPVDQEINGHRKNTSSDVDRSPDVDDNSDEEDGPEFNDYSSNEDLSDSEPTMTEHEAVARGRQRKLSRSKARPAISQRNFKQKFRALLKRFKISEDVLTTLDSEADHDQIQNQELDDLFDELEDSDSGPELDTMSVMSTPKPKLRPFFAGRGTTPEASEIPKTPSSQVNEHVVLYRFYRILLFCGNFLGESQPIEIPSPASSLSLLKLTYHQKEQEALQGMGWYCYKTNRGKGN